MKTTLRALLLLIVCLPPRASAATELGSVTTGIGHTSSGPNVFFSPISIEVCFGHHDDEPCDSERGRLFESFLFSTADAGSTVTATAENDPDFAAAAQLLTDGVFGWVEITDHQPGGAGSSIAFPEPFLSGVAGADFAGYMIESIQLRIHDDFHVTIEPADTPGDMLFVAEGQVTLRILGSPVPEPSPALLLCIGLAAVSVIRRETNVKSPCRRALR